MVSEGSNLVRLEGGGSAERPPVLWWSRECRKTPLLRPEGSTAGLSPGCSRWGGQQFPPLG